MDARPPPDPPLERDSHNQDPPQPGWGRRLRRGAGYAVVGLLSLLTTYLGICVAGLLLYTSVFPPTTGVQLQRQVEGLVDDSTPDRRYTPRPLAELSPALPHAVVAGEDSRFFQHNGIDWEAVGEAIEEYRRGEGLRGGSTITQQLVKNLFMTTHSTSLRKALEVPLTYAAEGLLSKRRILELYVNVIEWGPGVYGAEAASQHYYGQSGRTLSRTQAAALAACIPNPLARRPATVGWYQRIILRRMDRLGPLPLSR